MDAARGKDPPVEPATTLPARQVVYLAENPTLSDVTVWYHGVSIDIGMGPDPAVEKAILNSISYHPDAGPDTRHHQPGRLHHAAVPGGACLADRRPGLPDRVRRMWSNRCGPV